MNDGIDISPQRRVILHCGVQKTASTSLHHLVRRNRGALGPHVEFLAPVKGSTTRETGRAAMQFSLDPSPEKRAAFAGLVRKLRDLLMSGEGTAIVSHENLPGAMIGKGGVTTLYPMLEEIVALLEAELAPLVPEYVFYTRDMGAWRHSVYNQAVKSDRYTHPRETFLEETANCGTWEGLEQRMQALVGADRVRFFRLEDEPDPARPGVQLLRHAGLDDAVIDALEPLAAPSNASLNRGALEFLRLVNNAKLDRKARTLIGDLVTRNQTLFVSA